MIVLTREVEKILSNFTWLPEELTIDYDLTNDDGIIQNAITYFHRLQTTEIELEFNNKPTSRYCLVKRFLKRDVCINYENISNIFFHPILGSRPHCNKTK
jgi:tRNA pseudouridine65 synthase